MPNSCVMVSHSAVSSLAVCLAGLVLLSGCADDRGGSGGACFEDAEEGCICAENSLESEVRFEGTCSPAGVGQPAVCCEGTNTYYGDYCRCEPVRCGITSDGLCLCGVGVWFNFIRSVDSCTGTAPTCCTQDTGYCYCEEGCERRFANRVVGDCDLTTNTAVCPSHEFDVGSCQ